MKSTLKTMLPLAVTVLLIGAAIIAGPGMIERLAYAMERGKMEATREQLAELSKNDQLSELFRTVAKVVKPAVVEVRVTKIIEQPAMTLPDFGPDFPFKFRLPGRSGKSPSARKREVRGLGSGVIVDAANGYVLTNYHVVGNADKVQIVTAGGEKFEAQWVRSDPQSDLAVVKIEPDGFTEAPLGDSDAAEVGDWVLAIGAPRRLPQTVTAGIISAKGRELFSRDPRSGMQTYQDSIQTDAAINRGNSGGPLVNMKGEVIGINNAILSYTGGNEGIGFAIPSNMARGIMDQLIDKGKVVRGFLGVGIENLTARAVEGLKLSDDNGVLVTKVMKDAPAAKAGFEVGDVIVSVDGKATSDVHELRKAIAATEPDSKIEVVVIRNSVKMTLYVTIAPQPRSMTGEIADESPEVKTAGRILGVETKTMTDELAAQYGYDETIKGALIAQIDEDSDAHKQGLRPGMVIMKIQGKKVESSGDIADVLDQVGNEYLRLQVADPRGGVRLVFIKPAKD